ncbi:MAG: hypothetical protein E2O40_06845 [Planctomycetota bacterium]|nr:MAG: hypothetical protein E2O40_06845 [Planctomycetota bacterium]
MQKLLAAVTVLAVSSAQAGTLFVDDDAPLGGDGQSWDTAYRFLQDALADAVGGTEIRIAEGVYTPDQDESGNVVPGDRWATFPLVLGMSLVGGYSGFGARYPDVRDIGLYETILSGDLLGDDGPGFANNDDNSLHIITASATDGAAVLDGLTIRAGNANGEFQPVCRDRCGGGILNLGGSPTLIECTFEGNAAMSSGGAMYTSQAGNPALTDCTFVGNFAGQQGGGMYSRDSSGPSIIGCTFLGNTADFFGGAMYNFSSDATIVGCTFEGNTAVGFAGAVANFVGDSMLIDCIFLENTGGWGGAAWGGLMFSGCVFIGNSATYTDSGGGGALFGGVIVTNCTFIENTTAWRGGAMWTSGTISQCVFIDNTAPNDLGGALYINNATGAVTDCIFEGNHAARGGAIANRNSPTVIANCAFAANSSDGHGGAIDNVDNDPFVPNAPLIVNCTFGGNSAGASGGGIFNQALADDPPVLTNCILWGNSPDQISSAFVPDVRYSNVEGGWPGAGNIDADPMFVDPDNGDLRLSPGSPCIDAGDNTAVLADMTADLDGNPRFLEIPETPDTGNGTLPLVDIGAYESLGGGCLAVTSQQIVCHTDGMTFTVNVEGLNACTGGTTQVTFTASGGSVGEELCFTALVNDGGFCCATEICVTIPDCTPAALPSDLNGDGTVGMEDFLALLAAWGSCADCGTCPADFDGDCSVGITDFLLMLGNWG